MSEIGYEFLRQSMTLSASPLVRVARSGPAIRVIHEDDRIIVPRQVAPETDDALNHVIFALKHEGTNLQVLSEALPRIPAERMLAELRASPTGLYIRTACFLWESFKGTQLEGIPPIAGNNAYVFDPERYHTLPGTRNARWRVIFNGLGTLKYCATIERNERIQAALESQILQKTNDLVNKLGPTVLDRTLEWAYMAETQGSFEIEKETPSATRAERFVSLLRRAQEDTPLSEDYLVQLQQQTVSNSLDEAQQFRNEQNHLAKAGRGAAAVDYVPPTPELARELMEELMAFANSKPDAIDPLLLAGLVSFGFVFIHPFMDGNGRISRFLFHKTLCMTGKLARGLLLPVSVAMKKDEEGYMQVLRAYSKPLRRLWAVTPLDSERFDFEFRGSEGVYRYWDATPCVEFGLRMAEAALNVQLREETEFLMRYDAIMKAVSEKFDVRQSTLSKLVVMCIDNNNAVSNNRRKQHQYDVPQGFFDYLEEVAQQTMSRSEGSLEQGYAPGTQADL